MESNQNKPEVVSSTSASDEQPDIQSQDKSIVDCKSKEHAIKVNKYRQVVSKYARNRQNQNNSTSKEASGENKEYVRIVDMKNHQKAKDKPSCESRDKHSHNARDETGHNSRDRLDEHARDKPDHDVKDKLDDQATDKPNYDDNDKPGFESKSKSGGCNDTDENMCLQMEETNKDLSEESHPHGRKRKIESDSQEPRQKFMFVENETGYSVRNESPEKEHTKDLSPKPNITEKDNNGNSDMSPNSIKMKFIRNKKDNGDTCLSEYTVQTEVCEHGTDTENTQVSKMISEDEINNNFQSENITETKLSGDQDERQNLVKDCSVKVEKIRFQSKHKMAGYCHRKQDWKTSLKIKQASDGSFIIVDKCKSEQYLDTNKQCHTENIIEKRSLKLSQNNILVESETSDEECLDDKVEKRAVVVLTDIIQEIEDVNKNKDLMHDKNKADLVKSKENFNKWNVKDKSRFLQIPLTQNDPQIRRLEPEYKHKGKEQKYICSPKVISGIKRSKDKRGDENLSTEMSILRQFVSKEKRSSDQVIDCDIGPSDNKYNTNIAMPKNESDFEESEAPIETNKNKTEKVSVEETNENTTEKVSIKGINENTTEKIFLHDTYENNFEKVSMKDVNENYIQRVTIKDMRENNMEKVLINDTNENDTQGVAIQETGENNTEKVSLKEDTEIIIGKDEEIIPTKNEDYKVISHPSEESEIGKSDLKESELCYEIIEKNESDAEELLDLSDSVVDCTKSENCPEGNSHTSDFGIIQDGEKNVEDVYIEEMETTNDIRECYKRKNEDSMMKVKESPSMIMEKESVPETVQVKLPKLEGTISPKVIETELGNMKEIESPKLTEAKSPTLNESKSPNLSGAESPTLKESKSPISKESKSPTLKESKSPTLKESKSPNLREAESPKLRVAKLLKLKVEKSLKLEVEKSPKLKVVKSPNLSEGKSPKPLKLKIVKSPNLKEAKSPYSEAKSPNLMEAQSPKLNQAKSPDWKETNSPKSLKLKEITSPKLKEAKSPNLTEAISPNMTEAILPKLKEAKSPILNETKSPKLKEAKSPILNETKSPKLKEAKSPILNEAKSPKLKEAKPPNLTEANSPKLKDKKAPKQKRSKSTKLKGVKSPELKEAQPLEPKVINSPKLKETKAPKLKAMFHRCSSCEMTFGMFSELRAHKKVDHPNECQKCGMVFFNQATMKEHLKTHAKFTCHQCDKGFLHFKGYKYHMASITHAKVAAAIAVKNGKKEQKRKEEELISAVASIQEHQQYSIQGSQFPMEEGPYHLYDNVAHSGGVYQHNPTQGHDYNQNTSSYSWTAWMNESYQPISHEFMDQDQQTNVLYSSNNYIQDYDNNMFTYDTNTSVDKNLQLSANQQFNQYPNQNKCAPDEYRMDSKKSMSYFYQGCDNTCYGNDQQISYNTTQEVPNNQHVMFETNSNQVINLQEVPGTEQLAFETNGNLSQNYQEVPRNDLQGFNTSLNGSQVENYQQVPQNGQFNEFLSMNNDNQTQAVNYSMHNQQQSSMTYEGQGYENIQPLLPASGAVPASTFSEMEINFTEL